MIKPDWKCVFTYVQSFYRRFRNGRDPPPTTRVLIPRSDGGDNQVRKTDHSDKPVSNNLFSEKIDDSSTPLSPEKQKSLLSKYLIDDEKEGAGDERSKVRQTSSSSSFRQKSNFPTRQQRPPPLANSLSLSYSCPDKLPDRPNPFRLTSVEEKVAETAEEHDDHLDKVDDVRGGETLNSCAGIVSSELCDISHATSKVNVSTNSTTNADSSSSVSVTKSSPSSSPKLATEWLSIILRRA